MKITVITPCYNPGRYLLPMLRSVAQQSSWVAKHIVMDGGSTDGTVEILRKWSADFPWFEFFSEPDNGQADACNKALARTETEYFFWLNADDIMCEGALEQLVNVAEKSSHPAIVYGDYLRIDGDGKVYAKRRQPSFNYWDCLHGYLTVQNVAAIFNAPILRSLGGFDSSLRFVMDYDIIQKLGKKRGSVKHVKFFCGAFRVHQSSKTTTINDVCLYETEKLRTKYGVSGNKIIRNGLFYLSKMHVFLRMLLEGCMKDRLY